MKQLIIVLAAALLLPGAVLADTTITYQGQLKRSGSPFTGTATLEFRLFDAEVDGNQLGPTEIREDWPVENGLFQTELDFGENYSDPRWLEIRADATVLSPRQRIRSAPMAVRALEAVSALGPWQSNASGDLSYNGGQVAIGTSPREQLSIGAHLDLYSGSDHNPPRPSIRGSGSDNLILSAAGSGATFINHDSGSGGIRFHNGTGSGGEVMRLTGSGQLGIGTRTPRETLHVVGRTAIMDTDGLPGSAQLYVEAAPNTTALSVWADGGPALSVNSLGNVQVGSNTIGDNSLTVHGLLSIQRMATGTTTELCRDSNFDVGNCSSSARYKQNIVTLDDDASELIAALRPVRYTWIESQKEDLGLIAEEVAEVIPELATYNDNGEIEGLRYSHLTAVLVKALQEQQAENVELRAELDRVRQDTGERLAALESLLLDSERVTEEDSR